nr:reverse transcriptase domain-containing protein [Tanacetum cinerariifolium]
MARMDSMTIKIDAQYKELQSRTKQPTPDLDKDDMPMFREEEAKFMQTFCKTRFYNDYRDRDSNRDNWCSSGQNDYNRDNYRSNTDDKSYDLQIQFNDFMKSQQSTNAFVKDTFMDLKNQLETFAKNHQASIQNLETKQRKQILHSIEGTILKEEIFSEFDKFIARVANENYDSESDEEEPKFKKITINTDYKIKTSLEEPSTDLKLKPLPDNLEYVFLEEPSFLPVIISSQLSAQNKSKLVSVLKNIKKPLPGKQHTFLVSTYYSANRRYNFLMIKSQLSKKRSPCVSPIHCVPKKGGIPVVTNENDELVPTRTVTGWYFCFLDGFSGYFQIPIDPMDQEKTMFTCPFGAYAYRRMPLGLCNAPTTFQRCMLAIFHDMIEESVEEKCHFMVKEEIMLGHNVSGAGLEVYKAKIDSMIVSSSRLNPTRGDCTKDVVEDISPIKEPQVLNALPTHPTLQLNMKFHPSSESLFTYVVWIFLLFLVYSVAPHYLLSLRNEDTIFDHGIYNSHFSRPDVSHRCGTVKKFNTHRSHMNECPMIIYGQNNPILDVLLFYFYPP